MSASQSQSVELSSGAQKRVDAALEVIEKYGGIDGAHHKQWVIDQVVRCLLGSDDKYQAWVEAMKGDYNEEDEAYEYDWDEGIPP